MSIKDHIQQIYDDHGRLTPEIVVDEARSTSHPLHAHFDWDDNSAAESWRREQARQLIRSVRIAYRKPSDGEQLSVRAFHSIRSEDGYAYRPADEIIQDPLATKILLADMRREWQALRSRYERFVEFVDMVRADVA
jgi:hypothetical protein